MLRALLLAPPGAGKGTQGERLAERHGVPHLATGDLLRDHVARGTDLGRAAQAHMDAGGLVPDDLVIAMVLERVGGTDGGEPMAGFLLDGFPRTLAQARAAHEWAVAADRTLHAVVVLDVPEEELVRRLLDRGRATGRSDDAEDVIRHRLSVYESSTAPLADFYADRGILVRVDGTGSVEEVTDRIDAAIAPLVAARG